MTRNPPLAVWISVALLVALLFGTLQWAGNRMNREQQDRLLETQTERLRDYLDTARAPRVVVLATSIGRAALPFKEVPGDPPLPWLHINQNGRRFMLFYRLLPELLNNPPEMLIVQSGLLLSDGNADTGETLTESVRRNLRQWRKIARHARFSKSYRLRLYDAEAAALQERLANYNPGQTWKTIYQTQLPDQKRFRARLVIAPQIAGALRKLAAHGSRIMLLDIPRSRSYESAFGADEALWLEKVKQQLGDISGLSIWRLGQSMDDECYSDFLHLRPTCRAALEPALAQLADEIRGQLHD